jgi:gas vesicle protein
MFGLGVLVGAGIGILFAPRSGQELRSDLMGRVDDLKNYATGKPAPSSSSSAHSGLSNTTTDYASNS